MTPHRPSLLAYRWLPMLLSTAAIAWYFLFLYRHSLNIPLSDDIIDALQFLITTSEAQSWRSAADALFEQHNDHRTASTRALYWLVWQVADSLDFRALTFLANGALCVILYLWYLAVRPQPRMAWIVAVAALLLFQLRAYGITLWPMAAFAYFYVFMYGFASLLCLVAGGWWRLALAIVFAILATFTLASGQTVWFVGLGLLAQQCFLLRSRPVTAFWLWLVAMLATMWCWRLGLETPNTMLSVLGHMLETPLHHVLYFFTLLGSALSESSVPVAASAGATMFGLLAFSTLRHRQSNNLALESFGWFIAMSAAAMVLGRGFFSELEYALGSRYSFPAVLMLTNNVIILVTRFRVVGERTLLLMCGLAAVFCTSSWLIHTAALQPHVEKRVDHYNKGIFWVYGEKGKTTRDIVYRAIELGVYDPPQRPYPKPTIGPTPVPEDN